jgi:hypothetical protein
LINQEDILFEVNTPIGVRIRTTKDYWRLITETKHRNMQGKLREITDAIESPDQIIASIKDPTVLLFYKEFTIRQWYCSIVKRLNGTGFLITAYVTNAIKKGEIIWPK